MSKDPIVHEKCNTCRFADYTDKLTYLAQGCVPLAIYLQ